MKLDDFMEQQGDQLPSDGETKKIANLAYELERAGEAVAKLEGELKEAKAHENRIEQEFLPGAMAAADVTEIALLDGTKVKVEDMVSCGLPKDDAKKREAIKWLDENGGSGIIDHGVFVSVKRGDPEKLKELLNLLQDNGFVPEVTLGVNYQTLSSWAREQIDAGLAIPRELFNLFVGKKAKLIKPKKGK
jgi:hypothetical protein